MSTPPTSRWILLVKAIPDVIFCCFFFLSDLVVLLYVSLTVCIMFCPSSLRLLLAVSFCSCLLVYMSSVISRPSLYN